MVVDVNGMSHKPKGLPQHVAGNYDGRATAVGDGDLDDGEPLDNVTRYMRDRSAAYRVKDADAMTPDEQREAAASGGWLEQAAVAARSDLDARAARTILERNAKDVDMARVLGGNPAAPDDVRARCAELVRLHDSPEQWAYRQACEALVAESDYGAIDWTDDKTLAVERTVDKQMLRALAFTGRGNAGIARRLVRNPYLSESDAMDLAVYWDGAEGGRVRAGLCARRGMSEELATAARMWMNPGSGLSLTARRACAVSLVRYSDAPDDLKIEAMRRFPAEVPEWAINNSGNSDRVLAEATRLARGEAVIDRALDNPSHGPETCRAAVSSPYTSTWNVVRAFADPAMPADVRADWADYDARHGNGWHWASVGLAKNPTLGAPQARDLYATGNPDVRRTLARNPALPDDITPRLLELRDPQTDEALARNPSAGRDACAELLRRHPDDEHVLFGLKDNPSADDGVRAEATRAWRIEHAKR